MKSPSKNTDQTELGDLPPSRRDHLDRIAQASTLDVRQLDALAESGKSSSGHVFVLLQSPPSLPPGPGGGEGPVLGARDDCAESRNPALHHSQYLEEAARKFLRAQDSEKE